MTARWPRVLAAACGLVVLAPGVATASCVPPGVSVADRSVGPGDAVTVSGTAWARGCSDTGGPPSPPMHGIVLTFDQGSDRTALTTVDADADYSFNVRVAIPTNARAGNASITATSRSGLDAAADVVVAADRTTDPTLPFTGGSFGMLALLGLVVVVAGAALQRRAGAKR